MARKTTLRIAAPAKKKSNGGLTKQRSTGKHDFELGMRIRYAGRDENLAIGACGDQARQ